MDCLAKDSGNICCFDECFAERTGIFANYSLNIEKLVNSITKGGNVTTSESEIVKNSVKTCKKINKSAVKQLVCKIPDTVYAFVQCVLRENYLNCPNVKENEDCRILAKVLNPCVALESPRPRKEITKKTSTEKSRTVKTAVAKDNLSSGYEANKKS